MMEMRIIREWVAKLEIVYYVRDITYITSVYNMLAINQTNL